MTPVPSALGGKMAVSGGIKPMGFLVWFSVPDKDVALRTLKMKGGAAGLPAHLFPRSVREVKTFQRAVREQEGRRTRDDGTITETTVAVVVETGEDIVYQVSRLVRDADEQIIEYAKAMRVVFNKVTLRISFNPLGGAARADTLDIMTEIEDFYDKHQTRVTGAQVRTIVRRYLSEERDEQSQRDGLGGLNLRGKSGGIYFVPSKHGDRLDELAEVLEELYPNRAYLHKVPMADTADEREIVLRHHLESVKGEISEAMTKTRELLSPERDRRPRSDAVEFELARHRRLQQRIHEYEQILQGDADDLHARSDVLARQLRRLETL